jgi:hypothetical protein
LGLSLAGSLIAGEVLLPSPAAASVLVKLSLKDLAGRADHALVGTVEAVTPRLVGGNHIVTDVRIRCTRELLGVPVGTVFTVRHLGGEVGELGQRVFGEASYRVGEEVLVLAEERAGSYYAVGMAQGALHIERDVQSGERRVHVDLAGAELQGPAAAAPSVNGTNVETVIGQLQSLLADKQAAQRAAAARATTPASASAPAPAKGGQ